VSTRGSCCDDGRLPDRRQGQEVGRDGHRASPLCRHRHRQADAHGVCDHDRRSRCTGEADPHLRHGDERPARARRLARRGRGHGRGDGVDRQLLEADLEPARGPVRAAPRQRCASQGRARSQDRRPRRRVDRGPVPPRPAAGELHPAPSRARAARARPVPDNPGPGAGLRDQPAGQGARRAPTSSSAR